MLAFFKLVELEFKRLFDKPLHLLIFFVLPLLLTIPAGLSSLNNDANRLVPAICDLAQNAESKALVKEIKADNSRWIEMTELEARLALERGDIQSLLIIPADYNPLPKIVKTPFGYRESNRAALTIAAGSERTGIVYLWQELAMKILTKQFEAKLVYRLLPVVQVQGISDSELKEIFYERIEEQKQDLGNLDLELFGLPESVLQRRDLLQLPSYNIELLFLSIFAMMAIFEQANVGFNERLKRSFLAFSMNAQAKNFALFLLGSSQLIFLHFVMRYLNPALNFSADVFSILLTFLLLQLAIANIFRLIPPKIRLLAAILYTLLSALLGGCYVWLPSKILKITVPFSSHAWAMAGLNGVLDVSVLRTAALGLILILFSNYIYYSLRRTVHENLN